MQNAETGMCDLWSMNRKSRIWETENRSTVEDSSSNLIFFIFSALSLPPKGFKAFFFKYPVSYMGREHVYK